MLRTLHTIVSSTKVIITPHPVKKPEGRKKIWHRHHSGYLLAFYLLALLLLLLSISPWSSLAEEQAIAGWLEKAKIYPGGLLIHAKLDTGAKTTSLNIQKLEEFEKNGQRWVRFQVVSRNNRSRIFERKVTRKVNIKRHGTEPLKRYVVKLGICVGNIYKVAEVNLADRRAFNYQMLIGRTFLTPNIIVDASKTYTLDQDCKPAIKP